MTPRKFRVIASGPGDQLKIFTVGPCILDVTPRGAEFNDPQKVNEMIAYVPADRILLIFEVSANGED